MPEISFYMFCSSLVSMLLGQEKQRGEKNCQQTHLRVVVKARTEACTPFACLTFFFQKLLLNSNKQRRARLETNLSAVNGPENREEK